MASDILTIEGYLASLAARLPGPRGGRGRVLDELRDGLTEAVARHTGSGRSRRAATEAALAEFGTVDQVVAAFAGELVTRQARHSIAALVLTGPMVGVWWLLLLTPQLPTGLPMLPVIGIAVFTGLAVLATTGRLTRWLPSTTPAHALAGETAVVLACVIGDIGMLATLAARTDAPLGLLAALAGSASLIRLACCAQLLYGCLTARNALHESGR